MSNCPTDFLDNAVAQCAIGTEMTSRNCISRAYYAAYHLSTQKWVPIKDNNAAGRHAKYIHQLLASPDNSPERKVGVKLKVLYSRRLKADYSLEDDLTVLEAQLQLVTTKELFSIVQAVV